MIGFCLFVFSSGKESENAAIQKWSALQIVVSLLHEGKIERADALTRKVITFGSFHSLILVVKL